MESEIKDCKYIIILKDRETEEIKDIEYEWNGSEESLDCYWQEGNYACDCNRFLVFYNDYDVLHPCGHERFELINMRKQDSKEYLYMVGE